MRKFTVTLHVTTDDSIDYAKLRLFFNGRRFRWHDTWIDTELVDGFEHAREQQGSSAKEPL